MFLPHPRVKVSIVGSLRDREVACSASDRQGSNFESCVWRTVSSQSSRHPQEILLAQFSLYAHKGGLKHDSFHFISFVLDVWPKCGPSAVGGGGGGRTTPPTSPGYGPVGPLVGKCLAGVADGGPTLNHHWINSIVFAGLVVLIAYSVKPILAERIVK